MSIGRRSVPCDSMRSFSTRCGSGTTGATAIHAAMAMSNHSGIESSQDMRALWRRGGRSAAMQVTPRLRCPAASRIDPAAQAAWR
jgi:hypothetical protein